MDSLGSSREAGKDQLDSLEAPGRQERINWTACEAPGRHQGGTREAAIWTAWEAGKNHLDSLEEHGSKGFGAQ